MNDTPRIALLTAAGSGLGAAAARELAANGWQVAILSSSGRGAALAQELGGVGVTGSNLRTEDLQRLADTAMQRWGRIDAVVNSAGHGPKGGLLEMSDADWQLGMEFYLLNVVRMARLVTPIMQAQGVGSIVNLSSYAAFEPEHDFPLSTLRAALSAFTKLYADEHAAQGIRMNCVLPGLMYTPLVAKLAEEFAGGDLEGFVAKRNAAVPIGQMGEGWDVAHAALFLASDEAKYVTATELVVDGGLTASTG
jgi:NAD(P)-dependent dehydrogenase (short-subunit alcohol dehydrogenase family)